ncbi:MAG: hypothetical protein ACD_23C00927G0001 [uncultured bacterium]|nr:MAG: hypothetical protein ACD_23C00927G0001 [uncultured bacterium]
MAKAANLSNLKPGDRVIAIDSAGIRYHGHLDHPNPCGQFYFMPDGPRQPFYAFPQQINATGERQPGFVGTIDDGMGLGSIERQKLYVEHMRRNT